MLVVQSCFKSYVSGKQTFPVLKNINVEIKEKDFVMIMGESGSGKSTFLNCISTLDQPSSGQVLFKGKTSPKPTHNVYNDLEIKMSRLSFKKTS